MQDDLFGAAPAPPAPPPSHARAPSAGSVQVAPAAAQWAALAAQLPRALRLGVSTWSYPGWDGLVWDGVYDASVLSKKGLSAYAQHPLMRTVSVDRTFWRPLSREQFAAMAAQVPADFRFMVKCPNVVTDALVRGEDGKGQTRNPAFLSPELAVSQCVLPTVQGLADQLGVLVFQLSPLPWHMRQELAVLWQQLGAMLAAVRQTLHSLPHGDSVIVAVEVRDPELLTPELAHVLRQHQATYCLGLHGKMPPIEAQLPLLRSLWPTPLVCRWSLNRSFGPFGYPQAQEAHAPFNAIVSPDPHTRALLARTAAGITGAGQPAFISISNDAEGSAPHSIALFAQALQDLQPPAKN